MPLPTLLTKGAITVSDGNQAEADKYRAIDYITGWLSKRVTGGPTPPTILPKKAGDRILLLESKTGSGKSTVMPPEIHLAFGEKKTLAVTQPRIISAVQTPNDILKFYPQFKLEDNLGYQTGGITKRTRRGILFMTIGVLYQQLRTQEDEALLRKYKFIIIDEVHERQVELDMTLNLVKALLERNWQSPECPFFILTSATFDIESLRVYFDTPPTHIIKVAGERAYSIEDNFLKVGIENYVNTAIEIAKKLHDNNPEDYRAYMEEVAKGRPPRENPAIDILIFVSGVEDIAKIEKVLTNDYAESNNPPIVLKLNSKILKSSGEGYTNIYSPLHILRTPSGKPAVRRIIIATDIAQTSLTIYSLKYCIDSGIRFSVTWNPDYNADVSLITQVSRATAIQRRGRVGRVSPGKWYPCFTEKVYNSLVENDFPDMVKTTLAANLLTMIVLKEDGLDVMTDLDFVNSIPTNLLMSSLEELYLISAIKYKSNILPDINEGMHIKADGPTKKVKIEGPDKIIATSIGKIINIIPMLNVTESRLILASYEYGVNTVLMITLACILHDGDMMFKRKYKLQEFIPNLQTQYLVHMDDFIDKLIAFQKISDYISKVCNDKSASETSLNSITEYGLKLGLAIGTEFNAIVELKDRILLALYENKMPLNEQYPNKIIIPDTDGNGMNEFMAQCKAIKSCIRDAFPHYKLELEYGNVYKSSYKGIQVHINSPLFSYLRDVEIKPKIIYTSGFKFGKSRNGKKYEFANSGPISVVDGFIEVDDSYGFT